MGIEHVKGHAPTEEAFTSGEMLHREETAIRSIADVAITGSTIVESGVNKAAKPATLKQVKLYNGLPQLHPDAACRGLGIDLLFPNEDDEVAVAAAKDVCRGCVVAEPCLDFAMETRQDEGVWGGTTGRERRSTHRRRSSAAK